jgi:hypothetical protein
MISVAETVDVVSVGGPCRAYVRRSSVQFSSVQFSSQATGVTDLVSGELDFAESEVSCE